MDVRDIEENAEELDREEPPTEQWENMQKELVTATVDYNLETLTGLIDKKLIDLSPRYQRRFRWDAVRRSKLIESFLMNVPIPPIFLNEDGVGEYSVIDGKQRLMAVNDFMNNRFELIGLTVFSSLNGSTFEHLPAKLQNALKTRCILRAIIILRQSDKAIKFVVFTRLNTGGVQLNAQEVRNSAYPGKLNNLILDLSELPKFHTLLRIGDRDKSAMYCEMRDAEFVLRYFAFRDDWQNFRGGIRNRLDQYMMENQEPTDDELIKLKADFLSALENVHACFGEYAFRRWVPEQRAWRNQVVASLYDAEMFGLQDFPINELVNCRERIIDGFKQLFFDQDFRQSIDAATNTPTFFKTRIKMFRQLVESILSE